MNWETSLTDMCPLVCVHFAACDQNVETLFIYQNRTFISQIHFVNEYLMQFQCYVYTECMYVQLPSMYVRSHNKC